MLQPQQGDLNGIPGIKRIENVPLPVGFYGFRADDGWWTPSKAVRDSTRGLAMQVNRGGCEKLRTDLPGGKSTELFIRFYMKG